MIGLNVRTGAMAALFLGALSVAGPAVAAPEAPSFTSSDYAKDMKLAMASDDAKWDDYRNEWHYRGYTTLWFYGADGTISKDDRQGNERKFDVDMDFSDVMDNFTIGISPRFEITKGDLSFMFQGSWQRWDSDFRDRQDRKWDTTLDFVFMDVGVFYRVAVIPIGEMKLGIEPNAGIRWTYMKLEVDPDVNTLEKEDRTRSWFDPYVGGRLRLDINREMNVTAWGTIGGFNVDLDELMWTAGAQFEYRFTPTWSGVVGYQAVSYDYQASDFEFDMTFDGPFIGVSYRR